MPPSKGCPIRTLADPALHISPTEHLQTLKPPLPTTISRFSIRNQDTSILVPPLVGGALVAAFSRAVADGLNNELLTHYYLNNVNVSIDRALDRLLANFTRCLWDDLFEFYTASAGGYTRQVKMLFEGPIKQLVLVLNGPETSACLLEHIGPGLSKRKPSWSKDTAGIDLQLSLQLLCGFWHREYPNLSPGGSPEELARAMTGRLRDGIAAQRLVSGIRSVLLSPHYLQIHIIETAVWDLVFGSRRQPPRDGFHVAQFRFECQLNISEAVSSHGVDIGSLKVTTGTSTEHTRTSVQEYVDKRWQRCGHLVLDCLNDAICAAHQSASQGEGATGMAIWDGSEGSEAYCPGLRLLHFEIEDGFLQVSVCAWAHTQIEVFQQLAWMCAALSESPFPGTVVESAVEIVRAVYTDESMLFDCKMVHQPMLDDERGRGMEGVSIARGFPID